MANSISQNPNSSRIILVIAGILVLSALGYFATRYFSARSEVKEKTFKVEQMSQEIRELETQLQDMEADKNMALTAKDDEIREKEEKIKELLSQLNRARQRKQADLATIRKMETQLEAQARRLEEYRLQVEQLQASNSELSGQVESLSQAEGQLRSENEDLIRQKEETEGKLEETIELASVLKTKDFQFYNVRKAGKEKVGTEFRRSSMKDLKVCFTVLENLVAKPGNRDIYMLVENPDGTANTNFNDESSGKFLYNGREKVYSTKMSLAYNRMAQEVCFNYTPAEENKYQKGIHYVSIFADGNMIGQGTFRLK